MENRWGDIVLETETHHLLTRKVGLIAGDGVRKPEVAHNILQEELDNLLPCDIRERYCFHPLSEVVCGHQQESELRQRSGDLSRQAPTA